MQITNIEVSFKRSRQPQQFESAGAEIKWSVALDDGEDAVKATETTLGQIKNIVLAELGLVKPGTNASASSVAAAPAPTPAPKAEGTAAAPKKTTAKTTADKPKDAPAQTSASDIPGEDPPTSNGVRMDGPVPSSNASDIPGEEPKQTAAPAQVQAAADGVEVTPEEVQALAHQLRKDGKVDTATVKALSREKFGVERISDLKPEQLAPYKAALLEAAKKFAGAADI